MNLFACFDLSLNLPWFSGVTHVGRATRFGPSSGTSYRALPLFRPSSLFTGVAGNCIMVKKLCRGSS
jgi:hypothetical protein